MPQSPLCRGKTQAGSGKLGALPETHGAGIQAEVQPVRPFCLGDAGCRLLTREWGAPSWNVRVKWKQLRLTEVFGHCCGAPPSALFCLTEARDPEEGTEAAGLQLEERQLPGTEGSSGRAGVVAQEAESLPETRWHPLSERLFRSWPKMSPPLWVDPDGVQVPGCCGWKLSVCLPLVSLPFK